MLPILAHLWHCSSPLLVQHLSRDLRPLLPTAAAITSKQNGLHGLVLMNQRRIRKMRKQRALALDASIDQLADLCDACRSGGNR